MLRAFFSSSIRGIPISRKTQPVRLAACGAGAGCDCGDQDYKLNRSEQAKTLRTLRKAYDSPVLPVSSFEGDGLDEIWKTIRGWQ